MRGKGISNSTGGNSLVGVAAVRSSNVGSESVLAVGADCVGMQRYTIRG